MKKIDIVPGGHAEVTGVIAKGWRNQKTRGTLVVTRPGQKPVLRSLKTRTDVDHALRKAAEYNALCQAQSS
jgi:hypothetical protein